MSPKSQVTGLQGDINQNQLLIIGEKNIERLYGNATLLLYT